MMVKSENRILFRHSNGKSEPFQKQIHVKYFTENKKASRCITKNH